MVAGIAPGQEGREGEQSPALGRFLPGEDMSRGRDSGRRVPVANEGRAVTASRLASRQVEKLWGRVAAPAELRRGAGARRADRRDLVPGRPRHGGGAAGQISADPREALDPGPPRRRGGAGGGPSARQGRGLGGARGGAGGADRARAEAAGGAGGASRRGGGRRHRGPCRLARGQGGRLLLFARRAPSMRSGRA